MKRPTSFLLSFAAIAISSLASGPPTIVSLTPNSGTGPSVTFQAVYADPNGASDLNEILLQVNTSQSSANAVTSINSRRRIISISPITPATCR